MSVKVEAAPSTSSGRPPITILKRSREDVQVSQTRFMRKTAKGKVMTCGSDFWLFCLLGADHAVLRERYVREDIPCGFEKCHLCADFPGFRPVLPTKGFLKHTKLDSKQGHWLVVDTNVVLHQVRFHERDVQGCDTYCHQMDLLISLPSSLPLVVPSTTIRETRHRSLPLYNRLQQLIQDEARTVWVWWNEERRETATFQEEDEVTGIEGINDRNDRGEYPRHHGDRFSLQSQPSEKPFTSTMSTYAPRPRLRRS